MRMRLALFLSLPLALAAAAPAPATAPGGQPADAPSASPSDTDTWAVVVEGDTTARRSTFTITDTTFSGSVYGQDFTGTLDGGRIEFRTGPFVWTGVLERDALRGEFRNGDSTQPWTAARVARSPGPSRHEFAPTKYHRLFGGSVEPALRLFPGDTVKTRTADAGGMDEHSKSVAWGGNPLTGPFHVEGAFPGDFLAVHFTTVRTNRDWAFSGRELVDTVLDARYLRDRKTDRIDNKWLIDPAGRTLRLDKPTQGLKDFRVPLAPFLGCVGVAPPDGAAASSRDSGAYGGNMECRFAAEGSTVYLPVHRLGALLMIGDGHAAQGDGELTGSAMETSMDVEFSVHVIPGASRGVPRIETAEYILSVGVAGSLDQAVKHATSDMARWLESDYGLTSQEAAYVLGFANVYDIPDMVGPFVGVSSRIAKKSLLPRKT